MTITKHFSLASLVGSSNMASASLLFISQGIFSHMIAHQELLTGNKGGVWKSVRLFSRSAAEIIMRGIIHEGRRIGQIPRGLPGGAWLQ